ncbi:hypothetical protein Tco_0319443 [Tanacetum coccineum]
MTPLFTTIKVISKHRTTQIYGVILPQHLTNQAMLESKAYKTYDAYATGEKIPKPKYVKNKADPESSPKKKSAQASTRKRLKATAKVAKSGKKKQPAQGLETLSEIAFGSCVDEGTGVLPGVPDGNNVEEEELDEDETNEEEVNELYRDMNVNLEGRDTKMTDALLANSKSRTSRRASPLRFAENKKLVNDQLEAEVLIRSSNEAKTSHAENLYKSLVDAYETDKDILETYGDTVTLKRRQDDEDEDEEPSARSNRGSKRRRAEKEPESTSAPKEKTSKTPHGHSHWISNLARKEDPRELFNELMDTPQDLLAFVLNWLKVDTLTLELLTATTDQLDWNNPEGRQYPHDMRKPLPLIPNSRGHQVIPFDHFINNDLAYLSDGVSSRTYATSVTKTKAADYGHIKWIEYLGRKRQQFYRYAVNRESAHIVYSRNKIIRIKKLMIVEWHNYKHLEWITVRRDDDKMYTFKEGDYNRLRLQDIEDMLLLLVQGKLTNLNIESDLKRKTPYTTYSNPKGFIYQNKDKKNRLMRIDKLHKFSDGTLNDVRSALDDTSKRTREFDESNANVLERFYTSAGNPVKEILLKLNLPDHRLLKDGCEERYEHVGPEVTSSQDGKVYKMVKRDYAWLMISRCSRSHILIQVKIKEQAQDLKSMITTSNHKLMIEVKRAQD